LGEQNRSARDGQRVRAYRLRADAVEREEL
jgi:hypothetical protein